MAMPGVTETTEGLLPSTDTETPIPAADPIIAA